jgi:hypothetical protein
MANPTALYRAVMAEIDRRRLELDVPMWAVDDRAGTQDGYYAKPLYAETRTGRQSGWQTLQLIVDALFPGGVDVQLRALNDDMPAAPRMVTKDPNAPGRMIRHWPTGSTSRSSAETGPPATSRRSVRPADRPLPDELPGPAGSGRGSAMAL